MIKYNGYPDGAIITAKQRASQIVEQIISRTQTVTTELFTDEELDDCGGCRLTRNEYAEVERHINEIGLRMYKIIEKPIAAADEKNNG